ncbi:sensor histidine kinase [Paraflavitalea pollutisoli]|uniref:sensor histidine kinase n=1 Tax=Paraflavitalea pollutisoli TaxID=3034143 RepID=UPI0023EB9687|nr:histidine kinase [Paraflavitalea sp. H1-2-19X]
MLFVLPPTCRAAFCGLIFMLASKISQAQDAASYAHDYRFTVLYYGEGDRPDWENSFNTAEKYFNYYEPVKREFHAVGVPIGEYPPTGRLNTATGLGVSLEKGDFAGAFGFPVRALSKTYTSYNVFDASGVSVIALGIHPGNANEYEYRLVLNDSVVAKDWSPFTKFKKVPATGYEYADMGRLCWPGQYVLIETRNRQSRLDAGSVVVNWPAKPVLAVSGTRVFFQEDNERGMNGYLEATLLHQKNATHKDPNTGVLQGLRLPGDKVYVSMIFDLKNVSPTFPYRAVLYRERRGVTDSVEIDLYFNDTYLRLKPEFFDQPGNYRLVVGNTYFFFNPAYRHWLLTIPFEVLPTPAFARKWSLLQLLPYIVGGLLLLALAIFLYYRRNARRIRRLEHAQQLRQWQLRSLQHQLNPHFLFNALGAIQNLIGRNDVQSAGRYLDRFSSLTRTVLETSGHELIPLEDELSMLQAYLEMEQLRTPFSFTIELADGIDATNTEIPGMLLQPYVENAVKHGVSGRDEGVITVQVSRQSDTLLFTVSDNGSGMQDARPRNGSTGMGLSIVNRRIDLLNEGYGAALIHTDIRSSEKGTHVTVQLKHWLDKNTINA